MSCLNTVGSLHDCDILMSLLSVLNIFKISMQKHGSVITFVDNGDGDGGDKKWHLVTKITNVAVSKEFFGNFQLTW